MYLQDNVFTIFPYRCFSHFLHDNYINGISLDMLFLLLLRIISGFYYFYYFWHNQLTVQSLGYKNSQCYQTLKIAFSQSPILNECLTLPTSYPIHTISKFQSWEEIKKGVQDQITFLVSLEKPLNIFWSVSALTQLACAFKQSYNVREPST